MKCRIRMTKYGVISAYASGNVKTSKRKNVREVLGRAEGMLEKV